MPLGLKKKPRPSKLAQLYYELLFAVERMHPNETRHQTALRYIKEKEKTDQFSGPVCQNP